VRFADTRVEIVPDGFAVVGGLAERAGAISAAEYYEGVSGVRAPARSAPATPGPGKCEPAARVEDFRASITY